MGHETQDKINTFSYKDDTGLKRNEKVKQTAVLVWQAQHIIPHQHCHALFCAGDFTWCSTLHRRASSHARLTIHTLDRIVYSYVASSYS